MEPSLNRSLGSSTPSPVEGDLKSPRCKGLQDHEAGFWTRLIFRRVKRLYGHVPLGTRIRALDTKLLELCERMNAHNARSGVADAKLKQLVQLKVAAMVGCPF